jgi:hypothetical protein
MTLWRTIRRLLVSVASLTALLMAAGARWKP